MSRFRERFLRGCFGSGVPKEKRNFGVDKESAELSRVVRGTLEFRTVARSVPQAVFGFARRKISIESCLFGTLDAGFCTFSK